MKTLEKFKVLLWDFDGVILDSMPIRSQGFSKVLEDFPKEQVDKLLVYHHQNGGLSRYVKFRYFFEVIRGEDISIEQVNIFASKFSEVMLSLLLNPALLIDDAVSFIKAQYNNYDMHIVSGSDGDELRIICQELGLSQYFLSINGSPIAKTQLIADVIVNCGYNRDNMLMIGDSQNDFDAAVANEIAFVAYNNESLRAGNVYIDRFQEIE